MSCDFDGDSALIYSESPTDAYWLRGLVDQIQQAGYAVRVDTKNVSCLKVILPLVKEQKPERSSPDIHYV